MRVGTKSLLFGAHCFFIHPIALAIAWKKLYGFPWNPKLWIAFIVHDWGYWGKKKMDDEEGESHPIIGAKIMGYFFGEKWHDFTLLHSRFYSKKLNRPFSRLCIADKLATCIMPNWLYVPLVTLSGEVWEYMQAGQKYGKEYSTLIEDAETPIEWFPRCKQYMLSWIEKNKQYAVDPWDDTIQSAAKNS